MDFLFSYLLLDCVSRFLRPGLESERTVEGQPTGRLLRPFSNLSLLLRLSKIRSSLPEVGLLEVSGFGLGRRMESNGGRDGVGLLTGT